MQAKSILVVEDDPSIRSGLQLLFELEGFHVFTASNGREGVEILRNQQKPGMIFLDLMMPVMDGWEFLERRKLDPELSQIPVVVLSANGSRTKPEGAVEFFQKPFEVDSVLKIARKYCANQLVA